MKMKSLAILAMSGLLAASFAYAAPDQGDDLAGDDQAMQIASGPDTTNVGQDGGAAQDKGSSQTDGSSVTGTNADNTDDGSPEQDTPSGDDDY